ncbi:hypothetical protein N7490_009676 [Penicillium lividum]|nr:hypothetical protein N7490_009676 [Penicillium lividum]
MHTIRDSLPKPVRRAATIDFIDKRLPELDLHPAFNHPNVDYDSYSQGFVPTWALSAAGKQIPARPESAPLNAMKFWTKIFPESMIDLKQKYPEPQGQLKEGYSIRSQQNWQGVRSQLEKAHGQYELPKRNSAKSIFRRTYRSMASKSDQLKAISKIAAQVDYISPFLAIVDILLDAAAMACQVREGVTAALDPKSLEDDFERIEFFLDTFPRDPKIKKTSVVLVVAILKAIEDVIGYFLSRQVKRMMEALGKGKDYQGAMMESIKNIARHSSRLVAFATEADMHNNRTALDMLIQGTGDVAKMTHANMQKLDYESKLADLRDARMMNVMKDLFLMAEKEVARRAHQQEERETKMKQEQQMRDQEQEIRFRDLCSKLQRQQNSNIQHQQPNTQPSPPVLVNPTGFIPPFTTLAPPPFWCLLPQWPSTPQPILITHDLLVTTLDLPSNEIEDISYVLFHRLQISASSRGRAEAAVFSREFRRWLGASFSCELLIQGDPESDGYEFSGVSLISALVCSTLNSREGQLRLVWFCSLHDNNDTSSCSSVDSDNDVHPQTRRDGPIAMLASFIVQLLHQYAFDFTLWPGSAAANIFQLQDLANRNMRTLTSLFEWLVRQLPPGTILSVVIDEVGCYETDVYCQDMVTELKLLMRLRRSTDLNCIVKVLATSSGMTDEVRDLFSEDEDSLLAFDTLEAIDELRELGVDQDYSGDESE